MDRWWNSKATATAVANSWDAGDDPSDLIGSALLVLHAIGNEALSHNAVSLSGGSFKQALASIEDDPLVGAVCKAFDDATGISGYGPTRVAQLKMSADAGARALFSSLILNKVPATLAIIRAGESYGLPSNEVQVISKSASSHDVVAAKAADQALMKWAAYITSVEPVRLAKAETDSFIVDGETVTVMRGDDGRFVSEGATSTAAPLSAKEAKAKRAEERKAAYLKEVSSRKRKALPQQNKTKTLPLEVVAAKPQEEKKEQKAEQKAEQTPEWKTHRERVMRVMAQQEADEAVEAQQAASARASRSEKYAEGERRMAPWHEAARLSATTSAKGKDALRQTASAQTPEQEKKLGKVEFFSPQNPSNTAIKQTVNGREVTVPLLYKRQNATKTEAEAEADIVEMYSGLPANSSGKEVDSAFNLTAGFVELLADKDAAPVVSLAFAADNVLPASRGSRKAESAEHTLMRTQLREAVLEHLEPKAKQSQNHAYSHTQQFPSFSTLAQGSDRFGTIDYAAHVATDVFNAMQYEIKQDQLLREMAVSSDSHIRNTAQAFIRALQIHEMTTTPDHFVADASVNIGYSNYEVPFRIVSTTTGADIWSSNANGQNIEYDSDVEAIEDALYRGMSQAESQFKDESKVNYRIVVDPFIRTGGSTVSSFADAVDLNVAASSPKRTFGGSEILDLNIPGGAKGGPITGHNFAAEQKHQGIGGKYSGDKVKDILAHIASMEKFVGTGE